MDHADHVALLEKGVPGPGVWADLGSGTGAFTLALADLLGPEGEIYSLDKDAGALRQQERAMRARFPDVRVHYLVADLTRPFPDLPALDGVVAANVLHFFRDKEPVLGRIRAALKRKGRLLLVEYNADHGNPWVPYPLSYRAWETLAARSGFAGTRLMETRPSRHLREIYAAMAWRADAGSDE
ncbi:MAG TPA: class I SAM-dependent methyltransferase [Anaerolineae bacterium]|nr:class I SAM-dependent methyltransferase [Anaerolineae bacterium]